MTPVPEIAILGHPNEGKSSVLSTLAEDDSVRVSPTPGETTECRTFPVAIDGREVLRFTDTPGFQNPSRVLAEMRMLAAEGGEPVRRFREKFAHIPELSDDVELLAPIERGAGIIYVVDGSRPLRNVDRAEMEILRLTGRPRMAIINCKDDDEEQLNTWKTEFRKNFNANRVFNAHRATYAERILLLEALKSIDQDWQPTLDAVVQAFKADWQARTEATVDILLTMFADCLGYNVSRELTESERPEEIELELTRNYQQKLEKKEREAHRRIRALYKHNIFSYELPPQSILTEQLFAERTWSLLGLSQKQVAVAGAVGGAVVGAKLDLLTAGLSFGLFTGLGGAAGALTGMMGGKRIGEAARSLLGLKLGGERVTIGPAADINLLMILINRGLLFYRHTINWAHGRRDYQTGLPAPISENFTAGWPAEHLRLAKAFFTAVTRQQLTEQQKTRAQLADILITNLRAISHQQ